MLLPTLNKLFNIRPREWPRLLILFGMAFLIILANTWGRTTVYGAFLQQAGIDNLPRIMPLVLLANAIFSLLSISIYLAFADRLNNRRLLLLILAVAVVGLGSGRFLLAMQLPQIAYPLLYLIFLVVVQDTFFLHWWTYVNGFYDTRAAKRIVPIVATGARLASIVGGLSLPLLNRWVPTEVQLFLWIGLMVGVGIFAMLMPILLPEQKVLLTSSSAKKETAVSKPGYAANLKEGFQFISETPYLRWLAISTLSLMVLLPILNYQTSNLLVANFSSAEAIASFVGQLIGVANLVLLPIQLFLLSRLIGKIGLNNANILYPTTAVASIGLLIFVPGVASAALAYLARTVLRTTFRNPLDSLLYNAVPLRIKARARAFVSGLIVPIGSLIGGVLLLMPIVTTNWFVPSLLATLTLLYFISVFGVRWHYSAALLKLLEEEDYTFLLEQQASELMVIDQVALRQLEEKLKRSVDDSSIIFIAKLISEVGGNAATPMLIEAVREHDGMVRALLVEIMTGAEMAETAVLNLYVSLLNDETPAVRMAALRGLEQLFGDAHPAVQQGAVQLLQDPHSEVRLVALPVLLNAADGQKRQAALDYTIPLLTSESAEQRLHGVQIIAQAGSPSLLLHLLDCAGDEADEVRLATALAIEQLVPQLSGSQMADLQAISNHWQHDPIARVRQSALHLLALLPPEGVTDQLIASLPDESSLVKQTAVSLLVRQGRRAVPQLELVASNQPEQAYFVLSQIDARRYARSLEALISKKLKTIYLTIEQIRTLKELPRTDALDLLIQLLCEQNDSRLETIFDLLTAVNDPTSLHLIQEMLGSTDGRLQANALEALESLTNPKTAELIAPLFLQNNEREQLRLRSVHWPNIPLSTPEQLFADWLTAPDHSWLAEVATETARSLTNDLPTLAAHLPAPSHGHEENPYKIQAVQEQTMLSILERIIFLKDVPFFAGMTVEQLRVLAAVCEESFYSADTKIYQQGEQGGELYVVVRGRVALERAARRRGSSIRLAVIDAHAYFGEMNLFDGSVREETAVTVQDTLTLTLRREPIITLARQYPDLSLHLIDVLSQRLREMSNRVADLSPTHPRELHKLFDQFD